MDSADEGKGKGKFHPRTGHQSPDWEQRYNSTLSLTSALDGGGWSTPRSGRFTPGKDLVPIVQEAGWAPGPVWTGSEKSRPYRDSIPGPSSPQRVAILTELSGPDSAVIYLFCMLCFQGLGLRGGLQIKIKNRTTNSRWFYSRYFRRFNNQCTVSVFRIAEVCVCKILEPMLKTDTKW